MENEKKKSKLTTYLEGVTQRNMRSLSESLMGTEGPAQSTNPPAPAPELKKAGERRNAWEVLKDPFNQKDVGKGEPNRLAAYADQVNNSNNPYLALSRVQKSADEGSEAFVRTVKDAVTTVFQGADAVERRPDGIGPNRSALETEIADKYKKPDEGVAEPAKEPTKEPTKALSAFEERYRRKVKQQIDQDLKTTGLDPTNDDNVNALLKMRTLGLDGYDFLKARTAFQQRGEEAKWLNATVEDKIGYTQLHAASAILEGNKSDTYGLRERRSTKAEGGRGGTVYQTERYYTKKGAEVNKLRMLNDLVERGVISPSEVALGGKLITDDTRGAKGTRLNTTALDNIIYKKETDLKMAEQEAATANQVVLKEQAEADLMKLGAAKKYWKQRKADDAVFDSLDTRIATNGESYTSVLSDWYAMKKQLSSTTLTPERRKDIEKAARGMLVKNNIPSGFAIVYSKYQKDGIHAKSF